MLTFTFGKTPAGAPMGLIESQEPVDAVRLMRALKHAFPEVWRQVNLEIDIVAPAIDTKRLIEANGS